ncbi:ion transporter [Ketobacter sp.]|uniref:ion transporter n=1 Tax=Ketobacter sp. TaxID=2083498 RepID=UPI000F13EE4A|nr:ion transporter [Ketobacter sp.]RLT96359.1 MAG: ion transporter [Ketobacter sp.]
MKEKGSAIYQLFMLALSVYVLSALTLEMFIVQDDEIKKVLQYVDLAICMFFLFDFFLNLITAESKLKYLKWGWIDLISSIPVLDSLRWGRLSKVIRIVRFLRSLRSIKAIYENVQSSKIQSLSFVVLLVTFLSYTVCASLILHFERESNVGLNTAAEALWWAFLNIMNAKISIATAETHAGQLMTILLNKIGLLLFAYFNGIIIAWLVQKRIEIKSSAVGS